MVRYAWSHPATSRAAATSTASSRSRSATSTARRVPDPSGDRPLSLFMPGAFAGLPEELRAGFAAVAPGTALAFHAFVPSGILAREILGGADADVYVSANVRFMADLWRAGLVPE